MALRHSSTTQSLSGNNEWKVEIDDQFGAFIGEFSIGGDQGVKITYDGNVKDVLAEPGIYPSKCTINFEVTNDNEEGLINDIRDADASRFSLKVFLNDEIFWVGRFTPDNITIQNISKPYTCKLEANDGLIELKNREPNFPFVEEFDHDFMLYIRMCFNQMGVLSLYSTDVLAVTCLWWNSLHANDSDNPLGMTRTNTFAWMQESDQKTTDWEDIRWLDCFEILRRICVGWGMRLYYGVGMFHLEQINERGGGAYLKWFYDSGFNLTSTAISGDDRIIPSKGPGFEGPARGGIFGFLGPLKYVEVSVNVGEGNIMLGYEWDWEESTAEFDQTFRIIDQELLESHLRLEFYTAQRTNGISSLPVHTYEFEMEIKIGDTWVKRSVFAEQEFDSAGIIPIGYNRWYSEVTYEAGLNYYRTLGNKRMRTNQLYEGTYEDNVPFILDFDSFEDLGYNIGDEVRVIIKDVSLKFVWSDVDNANLDPSAGFFFAWWFHNASLKLIDADGNVITERRFIAQNDIEGDEKLEIQSYFGDFPGTVYNLEVYNGTEYVTATSTWELAGLSGTDAFSLLLAKQIMKLRKQTRKTYRGVIYSFDVFSTTVITLHGDQMTFAGGNLSSASEAMNAEWTEIFLDDISGITTEVETIADPTFPNQTIGQGGPTEAPGEPTGGLVTNEEIDGVNSYTQIDILNPSGVEFPAGTYVRITDESDGTSYIVLLADALEAADTFITIEPYTFPEVIPTLSPITLSLPVLQPYVYDANGDGANDYITVPSDWIFPDPANVDAEWIRNNIKVYLNGNRVKYNATPTLLRHFNFDNDGKVYFSKVLPTSYDVTVEWFGPAGI